MAYFISPVGNSQILNINGSPLNGGKIYTYLAGTTTPAAVYSGDIRTGAIVAQANPVILNSLGIPAAPIVMLGGVALKFIITDASNVTLITLDNVTGINDVTNVTTDEWALSGLTPSYVGAAVFSVVGDQTLILQVGRRTKTTNTSGPVYSTILSATFSAGVTTVTLKNDGAPLDTGLSVLSYGVLSSINSSLPNSANARAALDVPSNAEVVHSGYMQIQDQRASGTAGGASILGVNNRTLNTVVRNTIAGASVTASVITLPIGTYRINAQCMCVADTAAAHVTSHLYNSFVGAVAIPGLRSYMAVGTATASHVAGSLTLTATTTLLLRTQFSSANATGLGLAASFGNAEVFANIEIWKE